MFGFQVWIFKKALTNTCYIARRQASHFWTQWQCYHTGQHSAVSTGLTGLTCNDAWQPRTLMHQPVERHGDILMSNTPKHDPDPVFSKWAQRRLYRSILNTQPLYHSTFHNHQQCFYRHRSMDHHAAARFLLRRRGWASATLVVAPGATSVVAGALFFDFFAPPRFFLGGLEAFLLDPRPFGFFSFPLPLGFLPLGFFWLLLGFKSFTPFLGNSND